MVRYGAVSVVFPSAKCLAWSGLILACSLLFFLPLQAEAKTSAAFCNSPTDLSDYKPNAACFDPSAINICYLSLNNEKEFHLTQRYAEKLRMLNPDIKLNVIEFLPDQQDPRRALELMVKSGISCHGLVISGHHTGSWGGKRARGGLNLSHIENLSCDAEHTKFFTDISNLWLQGCRTLGHEDPRADGGDLVNFNAARVAQFLEVDGIEELDQWRLEENFADVFDRENPYSSRLNRAFPSSKIFGWTKTAPGERSGSERSLLFHFGNMAKLLQQKFGGDLRISKVDNPLSILTKANAPKIAQAIEEMLLRGGACEDCASKGWIIHGTRSRNKGFMGFDNPDLSYLNPLSNDESPDLINARNIDCRIRVRKNFTEVSQALDEALATMENVSFTLPSIWELSKSNSFTEDEQEIIKEKIGDSSALRQLLYIKLTSNNLGLARKLEYYSFYRDLIGGPNKEIEGLIIASAFEQIERPIPSSLTHPEEVIDYKLTLLTTLYKHGLLPEGHYFTVMNNPPDSGTLLALLRFYYSNLMREDNYLEDRTEDYTNFDFIAVRQSPHYTPTIGDILLRIGERFLSKESLDADVRKRAEDFLRKETLDLIKAKSLVVAQTPNRYIRRVRTFTHERDELILLVSEIVEIVRTAPDYDPLDIDRIVESISRSANDNGVALTILDQLLADPSLSEVERNELLPVALIFGADSVSEADWKKIVGRMFVRIKGQQASNALDELLYLYQVSDLDEATCVKVFKDTIDDVIAKLRSGVISEASSVVYSLLEGLRDSAERKMGTNVGEIRKSLMAPWAGEVALHLLKFAKEFPEIIVYVGASMTRLNPQDPKYRVLVEAYGELAQYAIENGKISSETYLQSQIVEGYLFGLQHDSFDHKERLNRVRDFLDLVDSRFEPYFSQFSDYLPSNILIGGLFECRSGFFIEATSGDLEGWGCQMKKVSAYPEDYHLMVLQKLREQFTWLPNKCWMYNAYLRYASKNMTKPAEFIEALKGCRSGEEETSLSERNYGAIMDIAEGSAMTEADKRKLFQMASEELLAKKSYRGVKILIEELMATEWFWNLSASERTQYVREFEVTANSYLDREEQANLESLLLGTMCMQVRLMSDCAERIDRFALNTELSQVGDSNFIQARIQSLILAHMSERDRKEKLTTFFEDTSLSFRQSVYIRRQAVMLHPNASYRATAELILEQTNVNPNSLEEINLLLEAALNEDEAIERLRAATVRLSEIESGRVSQAQIVAIDNILTKVFHTYTNLPEGIAFAIEAMNHVDNVERGETILSEIRQILWKTGYEIPDADALLERLWNKGIAVSRSMGERRIYSEAKVKLSWANILIEQPKYCSERLIPMVNTVASEFSRHQSRSKNDGYFTGLLARYACRAYIEGADVAVKAEIQDLMAKAERARDHNGYLSDLVFLVYRLKELGFNELIPANFSEFLVEKGKDRNGILIGFVSDYLAKQGEKKYWPDVKRAWNNSLNQGFFSISRVLSAALDSNFAPEVTRAWLSTTLNRAKNFTELQGSASELVRKMIQNFQRFPELSPIALGLRPYIRKDVEDIGLEVLLFVPGSKISPKDREAWMQWAESNLPSVLPSWFTLTKYARIDRAPKRNRLAALLTVARRMKLGPYGYYYSVQSISKFPFSTAERKRLYEALEENVLAARERVAPVPLAP